MHKAWDMEKLECETEKEGDVYFYELLMYLREQGQETNKQTGHSRAADPGVQIRYRAAQVCSEEFPTATSGKMREPRTRV